MSGAYSPAASDGLNSGKPWFRDAVTAVVDIKTTRGHIYLLNLMNGAAATSYLQIFFKPSASVTLGTTAPDFTIKLPTNAGSGFCQTIPFPVPIGDFLLAGGAGTGLSVAGTTTAAGSTTAAIGVSAVYA